MSKEKNKDSKEEKNVKKEAFYFSEKHKTIFASNKTEAVEKYNKLYKK